MLRRKFLVLLLAVCLALTMMSFPALADYSLPASFGAPTDFAVSFYSDRGDSYDGYTVTVEAPKDMRSFIDEVTPENSAFAQAGYKVSEYDVQLDFKTEGGSWHATSDWDTNYTTFKSQIRLEKGVYTTSATFTTGTMDGFASGEIPETTAYFDTHTWQFRVRLMASIQDKDGEYHNVFSFWSSPIDFNNNQPAENPDKLINHAPVLTAAEVKTYDDGRPYLRITSETAPTDVTHLNVISSNCVLIEVWIKTESSDWKDNSTDGNFVEQFDVDAVNSFETGTTDYAGATYQVKVRYKLTYNAYPKAGRDDTIYSPFSNVITHGLPAYSAASTWAKTELDKADANGLIPETLRGADMTKPITREEFAELAVVLYEKTTGLVAEPITANPFKDTINPQVLKAFNLGIVKGMSADIFAPKDLTNREQVATMLSRAIRIMVPKGDFSTTGAPSFSDQKLISDWANDHVLFMAKLGIIKGSNGKFMPKATTAAEIASGYATTTREMAIAMSQRIYDLYK